MTLDVKKALKIIQHGGLLSQALPGYEPREQQQKMMHNIIDAYNEDNIALIEAGTGTGKSFAYLIPAILWAAQQKERTVISTGTIALQEQLLHKDIPFILKALNIELKAVLVKGMSNYLCLRKLHDLKDQYLLYPVNEQEELRKLDSWGQTTKDGSRSSLPFAPTGATWEKVCAESDTCNSRKCPFYQECHFFKARKTAEDAQLLVVNHHLLFADLTRRAENDNYKDPAVLPLYNRVIIDEAHHIEDIATEYFASNVNRLGLMRIMGRLNAEKGAEGIGKLPALKQKIQDTYKSKSIPSAITILLSRLTIDLPGAREQLMTHLVQMFDAFTEFMRSQVASDSNDDSNSKLRLKGLHLSHFLWKDEVCTGVTRFIETAQRYTQIIDSTLEDLKNYEDDILKENISGVIFEIHALKNRLIESCESLTRFVVMKELPEKVRWIELQTTRVGTNIHMINADLNVAKSCVDYLFSKFPTIVLCSATLTTNQQFSYFRHRLGLTKELLPKQMLTENIYDSPFNFQQQAMLAVPTDLPSPLEPEFIAAAVEKIWQVIQVSRGNAFVLFTSYSMLKTCYNQLEARLKQHKYIPSKQGDESRQVLLNKFKANNRSVLFGTDSFWEGVDVVGDALRCVIIVKLPFKVPTEPIVQARSEAISAKGGDPFTEYSLPNAIVKFKQGFGRLIRNKRDRGCIVCLDTRLITKNYGKQFLNSLPLCHHVFGTSDVLEKQMTAFYRKTLHLTQKL